jgi:hypothetical protein
MNKIGDEIRPFFWDLDIESLDPKRHRTAIIERLLDMGDQRAVRWLFRTYRPDEVRSVLEASRCISPKSRGYWRLVLGGAPRV